MTYLRIGLIGAGSMAANHARVISESDDTELSVIVDIDKARAHRLASHFDALATDSLDPALDCDAVVVASATDSHTRIALELIAHRRPLLVEKPIATNLSDVLKVCSAARSANVPLCCGFVERHNPVVKTALDFLDAEPIHTVALRHSPADPRMTTSVIHDLLIHDIDLALQVRSKTATHRICATSWPGTKNDQELVDCTIEFAEGGVATMSASRVGQRKVRSMVILTNTVLFELDLLRSDLTVYRNVHQEQADPLTYRAETVVDIPFIRRSGEPLALQFEHFLRLVRDDADPNSEIESIIRPHKIADRVAREVRKNSLEPPPQRVGLSR
jgi:predicted dehydrogenase